jgi:hypothetical protein
VVPSSWHLLQAVERLVEPTHQIRVSRADKVSELGAVDYLNKGDVEEGVLDIELVHKTTPRDSKSQHSSDGLIRVMSSVRWRSKQHRGEAYPATRKRIWQRGGPRVSGRSQTRMSLD